MRMSTPCDVVLLSACGRAGHCHWVRDACAAAAARRRRQAGKRQRCGANSIERKHKSVFRREVPRADDSNKWRGEWVPGSSAGVGPGAAQAGRGTGQGMSTLALECMRAWSEFGTLG